MLSFVSLLAGCGRDYDHDSPEALLDATRQMVLEDDLHRLDELIHTKGDGERLVMERLARTAAALRDLGEAIAQTFPDEVERVRRRADEAVADGAVTGPIARTLTARAGSGRAVASGVGDRDRVREGLDAVLGGLLADPFGWLERHGDRLEPVRVTDDLVALQWMDRPVVGLRLVEQDGLWYYSIPFDLPMIRAFAPQNDDEFAIWAELVAVVHNMLLDLEKEVRGGEHQSLESVATRAGEYALPAAVMVMIAYGKALEERRGG